ncbi:MAG: energy transducer TonB [Planctomycetota bacterium]
MIRSRRFRSQGALPVEPRALGASFLLHAALLTAGLVFGRTRTMDRVAFRIDLETVRECDVESIEEEVVEPLPPVEAVPLPELPEPALEDPEDPWDPELFVPEEEFLPPEEPIPMSLWLQHVFDPEKQTEEVPETEQEEQPPPRPAVLPSAKPTPIPGENRPPRYPSRAIHLGWQGRVLLEVHVSDRGRVLLVRILESSGHGILDRAASKAIKQWRFHDGPGVVRLRVAFVIGD